MADKKHDLILKTLLLSATHLQLLKDDDYGGSDDEVELSNTCCEIICDIVGFDIAEDAKWGAYTIRATDEEITQYGINQLLSRYPEVCPTGKRIYVVGFEALYRPNEWRNIDELDVRIWDIDNNDDELELYKKCLSSMVKYLTPSQTREVKTELRL